MGGCNKIVFMKCSIKGWWEGLSAEERWVFSFYVLGTLVMVSVFVTGAVIGGHYVKIWLGRKSTSIAVAKQLENPTPTLSSQNQHSFHPEIFYICPTRPQ